MNSNKYNQARELAEMLSLGPERVYKEWVHDAITAMATDIYNSPYQQNKRHRTYEQVYDDCKHIVIEYALAQRLNGMRNPKEFDMTDPDSYIWDVSTETFSDDRILFECKRHKENGGEMFSYANSGMKTFLKHKDHLDYVVSARVIEEKDWYTVKFTYIMDAPSFEDYWQPSKFNPTWESFYNNGKSNRDNNCIKINVQ